MKRRFVTWLGCTVMAVVMFATGCGMNASESAQNSQQVEAESTSEDNKGTVYIVHTNDIHSYIYNSLDENEEGEQPLRMSNVAAMVDDMRLEGKKVILVDGGDAIQGSVYGTYDNGKSMIELMNACGYQLAVIGNHEFDYGMDEFKLRQQEADFPYIACNLHAVDPKNDVCEGTYMFDMDGTKVAFIGIASKETLTTAQPAYFQDEQGNKIYSVDGTKNLDDLYNCIQEKVDEVRKDADYVVALGHVGIEYLGAPDAYTSVGIIENCTGIDAFIDGHSHKIIENKKVKDKDGKEVTLASTGNALAKVGVIELGTEGITSSLVSAYDKKSEKVAEIEEKINGNVDKLMGSKIADLAIPLYVTDPDNDKNRLIRSREMNAGDFIADSIYWYFNYNMGIECDVAVSNGGGLRANFKPGDIKIIDNKNMLPFSDGTCIIEASGQEILDALEMGATEIGKVDPTTGAPAENGGFLQVAGMKYTIDGTYPSSVKVDEDEMFMSVDGEYRVKDVQIFDKKTGTYKPMELDKTYTIAGIDYLLKQGGNGLSMFMDNNHLVDFSTMDYLILCEYMKNFDAEGEYPVLKSENSPLKVLNGYTMNYEDVNGSGRINVILE